MTRYYHVFRNNWKAHRRKTTTYITTHKLHAPLFFIKKIKWNKVELSVQFSYTTQSFKDELNIDPLADFSKCFSCFEFWLTSSERLFISNSSRCNYTDEKCLWIAFLISHLRITRLGQNIKNFTHMIWQMIRFEVGESPRVIDLRVLMISKH